MNVLTTNSTLFPNFFFFHRGIPRIIFHIAMHIREILQEISNVVAESAVQLMLNY